MDLRHAGSPPGGRKRVALVRGILGREVDAVNLLADRVEGIDALVPRAGAVLQASARSRDFR